MLNNYYSSKQDAIVFITNAPERVITSTINILKHPENIKNNLKEISTSVKSQYPNPNYLLQMKDIMRTFIASGINIDEGVAIEDLNVSGMLKNHKLARAISDVGFGSIRRQLEYKAIRYDTRLIIADRWYPSSKLCSSCDWKNESLTLKDRSWRCQSCKTFHDREINAAINLERLASDTALPVASYSVTSNTKKGVIPS